MINWKEYKGHIPKIKGKRKKYDDTIYTFDIETTSYLILNEKQIPASKYQELTESEQEEAIPQSNMYIWQFSIDETVYFGRTFKEFHEFLKRIEEWSRRRRR